jgi:hypothetical protein
MVAGLDRDEHRDAEPDLFRIDHRDALLDHAFGLELLDALPAWRRGQPDAAADLRDGERGVLLQYAEYLPVDGVHATKPQFFRRSIPRRPMT